MNPIKPFILLIFYLTGFSAHPQLLVKENKIWSIAKCEVHNPCIASTTHYLIGDEIEINDTLYYTIMYSTEYQPYNWHVIDEKPYIREQDSVIYRRQSAGDAEFVVFDCSKEVGELFYINHPDSIYEMERISYRHVGGISLKHWYAKSVNSISRARFIDRVGSFLGFMKPIDAFDDIQYILCVSEDGEVFYQTVPNTCHITTITSSAGLLGNVAEPIIVSPRDNKQVLVTKHAETGGEIIFYTSTGREVKHSFLNDCETLLQLPIDGILIYQFVTNGGNVQSGRVLVR